MGGRIGRTPRRAGPRRDEQSALGDSIAGPFDGSRGLPRAGSAPSWSLCPDSALRQEDDARAPRVERNGARSHDRTDECGVELTSDSTATPRRWSHPPRAPGLLRLFPGAIRTIEGSERERGRGGNLRRDFIPGSISHHAISSPFTCRSSIVDSDNGGVNLGKRREGAGQDEPPEPSRIGGSARRR